MDKRSCMMRKKKAYNRQAIKPWSDLTHDVLFSVMMRLEVVDFLAFSKVCKPWRSFAISNRNEFIVSKPPMSISISSRDNKKRYYLKDFEGRKLRIRLPHSAKRRCIGVTCGYVILFGEKTSDLWLVNLITRHELHFPNVPDEFFCCPGNAWAILVYSHAISEWVFVMYNTCYHDKIWFSIAGKQEWNYVYSHLNIEDLTAFKGKIYTLHSRYPSHRVRLCEMKLYPEPELLLLKTKNLHKPDFTYPGFVSCGKNLYVIDRVSENPYNIHEIDLDGMKWVSRERTAEEYTFFHSNSKYVNHPSLYNGRYIVADKNGKGGTFYASLWYFFCDCLNVDRIHE